MITLLILEVPTLLGFNAKEIHRLATSVNATCAFCDSATPQVQVLGDSDLLSGVLSDLKRLGKIVLDAYVTPTGRAAT